jgi:prepilin-type N-terminal cleavage/methylation domain-containing protein
MKRSAFSLVELLIVVTIIAVLTGSAVPFVGEYLEQAKAAKARNDLDEISRAINAYEASTGLTYSDTTGNALLGSYLERIPADPWGVPYSFASATDRRGAFVSSAGPNRIFEDITDDIRFYYKGPLALVAAYWADVNNDGAISTYSDMYPSSDTLILRFNRQASFTSTAAPGAIWNSSTGNLGISPTSLSFDTLFDTAIASPVCSLDGKMFIYRFATSTPPALVLGSSTVWVTPNIVDAVGNPGQPASVTLLAQ